MQIQTNITRKPYSISVVMPVYNEERLLPLTLPSHYSPIVDEYLFVLDRCSDRSEQKIWEWSKRHNIQSLVRVLHYDKGSWTWRLPEIYDYGFSQAKGDVIFDSSADIIYDARAYHVPNLLQYGVTSFAVLVPKKLRDHLYKFTALRSRIKNRQFPIITYESSIKMSCLYATPRTVFQNLRFTDSISGDCTDYRKRVVKAGYPVRHFRHIKFTHLAYRRDPDYNRKKQIYTQIRNGMKLRREGQGFIRAWIHALVRLQPYSLLGYLYHHQWLSDPRFKTQFTQKKEETEKKMKNFNP